MLRHFSADVDPRDVAAHIRERGYAIVDRLVDEALMDRVAAELAPYIDATPTVSRAAPARWWRAPPAAASW